MSYTDALDISVKERLDLIGFIAEKQKEMQKAADRATTAIKEKYGK